MFSSLNSFRNKLLVSFLSFVLILIFTSAEIYWFNFRIAALSGLEGEFKKIMMLNLQIYKSEKVFIQKELTNLQFFKTGKSPYIDRHEDYLYENMQLVESLKKSKDVKRFGLLAGLDSLSEVLKNYEGNFTSVKENLQQRGFKDYGLEGEMRGYIHQLERGFPEFDRVLMLTMRRHEKDYIIRNDSTYVDNLNRTGQQALRTTYTSNKTRQEKIRALLKSYIFCFNNLVFFDKEINKGFDELNNHFSQNIETITVGLNKKLSASVKEETQALSSMLYLLLAASALLSVFLSYFLARIITQPVLDLTHAVEEVVNSNFEKEITLPSRWSKDEIGLLEERFYQMVKRIRTYVEQIRQTNSKLEDQNYSLSSLNSELQEANDVLLRKEEHIQKMNTVKDKFFAILSHDLRGPLTTIKGFLAIMTDHPESIPQEVRKDTLIKLRKSIELQLELLSNLLDWAGAQVDEMKLVPEDVSLGILVDKNIELVSEKANLKNIIIINALEDNTNVVADRNMINFVLRNLVSNALKFTNPGGKIVVRSDVSKEYTEISVTDNGIGIGEKAQKYIMKPGVHYSTTGTSNEKGTGFGLLLSKEFIEKHGGKIKIKSKPGEGTTVSFTLKNVTEMKPVKPVKSKVIFSESE